MSVHCGCYMLPENPILVPQAAVIYIVYKSTNVCMQKSEHALQIAAKIQSRQHINNSHYIHVSMCIGSIKTKRASQGGLVPALAVYLPICILCDFLSPLPPAPRSLEQTTIVDIARKEKDGSEVGFLTITLGHFSFCTLEIACFKPISPVCLLQQLDKIVKQSKP